jgi:DMSO/TMAO reductase YedYZ molybdopterin-dependent catalytic subunit
MKASENEGFYEQTSNPPQHRRTEMVTRGFTGPQRSPEIAKRLPPGQSLTSDFPVLSAGPTPHIRTEDWFFTLKVGPKPLVRWSWAEFNALPQTKQTRDIHCVTKWSKLDTVWEGVLIDDILAAAGLEAPPTPFTLAHSYGGYSTNVPTADLVGGKAMIALRYGGKPLSPDHGGPARLLVPHLYFWKSAKWVSGLQFTERDEAGFWELRGYHIYGDPWREQRFTGD